MTDRREFVKLMAAGSPPSRTRRAREGRRVVCAVDCGLVVNPLGARQQVESGVIWSLSNMKGEMTWKEGVARQATYGEFRVVTIDEAPGSVETHLVDPGRRIRRLPVRRADLGI